jgi:hypothetical protein
MSCRGLARRSWQGYQARYNRLVRRFGGAKNPAAKKKAITAIAHILLKIAYQVLKSGTPYQELGADFYTGRESPEQKQAWLERRLQKLHPGCNVRSPEARLKHPANSSPPDPQSWSRQPTSLSSCRTTDACPPPCHHSGQGRG